MESGLTPGQSFAFNGRVYRVEGPIVSPGAQGEAADLGVAIVRLTRDDQLPAVLKLSASWPWASQPELHARLLNAFSQLPGLQAAARNVVPISSLPRGAAEVPRTSAILMPWLGETSLRDMILVRKPLLPARSHALALKLARTLAALEQRQITHGALTPGHLLLIEQQTAFELVSLEGIWTLELPPEARPGVRPGPFTHPAAPSALRQPEGDRFAGALLIALLLGWCDTQVAQGGAGPDYFVPDELQSSGVRYNRLRNVLGGRWGGDCVSMFAQAWSSGRPEDCPSAAEWARLIEDLPIPTSVRSSAASPAGEPVRPPEAGVAVGPDGPHLAPEQRARDKLALGEGRLAESRLDEAIAAFEESHGLAANLAAPYLARALVQRAQQSADRGDIVAAQSDFDAALLVAPAGEQRAAIAQASAELALREAKVGAGTSPVRTEPPKPHVPPEPSDQKRRSGEAVLDAPVTTEQRPIWSWLAPIAAVIVLSVLLCAILSLGRGLLTVASPVVTPTTLAPSVVVTPIGGPSVPVAPTVPPVATSQVLPPTATFLPTQASTTRVPIVPTATSLTPITPTATSLALSTAPTITAIEPALLFADTLPVTLTITGSNLERVRAVALVAPGLDPLALGPVQLVEGRLEVQLLALERLPSRTASYTLRLDEVSYPTQSVRLVATRLASGISEASAFSSRLARDSGGLFTRMRINPNVESERVGVVRASDRLELLDDTVPEWYRVRILSSGDPTQIGIEGWIERWLLGEGQAPQPTPTVALARPTPTAVPKLRFSLLNYNDDPTCITVQISGINTRGWSFWANGTNLGGTFDYNAGTGRGNARLCGVGPGQEVTISVYNTSERRPSALVVGGVGVPAKGSAILTAVWR